MGASECLKGWLHRVGMRLSCMGDTIVHMRALLVSRGWRTWSVQKRVAYLCLAVFLRSYVQDSPYPVPMKKPTCLADGIQRTLHLQNSIAVIRRLLRAFQGEGSWGGDMWEVGKNHLNSVPFDFVPLSATLFHLGDSRVGFVRPRLNENM